MIFTVGDTSKDVTSVLNGMAAAYKGDKTSVNTGELALDTYLNPFSFTIPGFNDPVDNPAADIWRTAKVSLVGKYRVI